jgi:hypothetical protein
MEKINLKLRSAGPSILILATAGSVLLAALGKVEAAGFLLGGVFITYVFLIGGNLLELAVGPIKVRFQEKIAELEAVILRLRESSLSLARAISEVVINTGGEKYIGGFGEAAKLEIFKNLRALLIANDADFKKELSEFRDRLLRQYVFAIAGDDNVQKGAGALLTRLKETDFAVFPSVSELRSLIKTDGITGDWLDRVIAAYQSLYENWEVTDDELAGMLYGIRRRGKKE